MKVANLSDVKDRLSEYVEQVRHGERIRILVRGRAVAELVPTEAPAREQEALDGHLADLERRGLIRRGTGAPVPELSKPGPSLRGERISDTIRDERQRR